LADEGLKALEAELRATIPDGVRAIGDEHLKDLADAVTAVRHRQMAALAAAGDRALGHVPKLLRGPIRKIVS
jgi:hypothetical protein